MVMPTSGKPYAKKSERLASRKARANRIRRQRKAKSWRTER